MAIPSNRNIMNGQLTSISESSRVSPEPASPSLDSFKQTWCDTLPQQSTLAEYLSGSWLDQNSIFSYNLPYDSIPKSDYDYLDRPSDVSNMELRTPFLSTFAPSTKVEKMEGQIQDQKPEEYSLLAQSINTSPESPSAPSVTVTGSNDYGGIKKPSGSYANGGQYTCPYRPCTLRFEDLEELKEHKRKGHRRSAASVVPTSTTLTASQAGPHKCIRISPQTGQPCNISFSRPYDKTRHEDTVHNTGVKKPHRCPVCKEAKYFVRKDALTRHLKMMHPG